MIDFKSFSFASIAKECGTAVAINHKKYLQPFIDFTSEWMKLNYFFQLFRSSWNKKKVRTMIFYHKWERVETFTVIKIMTRKSFINSCFFSSPSFRCFSSHSPFLPRLFIWDVIRNSTWKTVINEITIKAQRQQFDSVFVCGI